MVLEEFGKVGGQRSAYFQAAYQAVEDSLKSGGPFKGALYWQNYVPGQDDPVAGGVGKFGVLPSDPAFGVAAGNAAALRQQVGSSGQCSKKAPGVTLCTRQGCAQRAGLGARAPLALRSLQGRSASPLFHACRYEGPGCELDIDECVRGTSGCGPGSVCTNTNGSFACAPAPASDAALLQFWTDPSGKGQACDIGVHIQYPKNVTGWVDDPTGSFDRNNATAGGFGSRAPVTPAQCAAACDNAPGCEMFTFNAALKQCFLKAKQCPLRDGCQVGAQRCTSLCLSLLSCMLNPGHAETRSFLYVHL